jgi:hypothetical protein
MLLWFIGFSFLGGVGAIAGPTSIGMVASHPPEWRPGMAGIRTSFRP